MDDNPLKIDPLNLEKEWIKQAELMWEWTKSAADAQHAYDTAKSNLSLTEADLASSIRDDPGLYGVSKISNEAVAVAVKIQPEYKSAVKKVDKARHTLALTNGMVTALDHKKRALGMLVELWVRDYYASPTGNKMSDEEKVAVRSRGRRKRQKEEDQLNE